MKIKKHKPIIWTPDAGTLEEFFQVAKGLELDFIIYVQDTYGDGKSVWACAKEDFVECIFTFSNKCYFGRVQSLSVAIEYGFDDEFRNN